VSAGLIQETVNSNVVPSFGAISLGPELIDHVVPVREISPQVKVAPFIGSLNITLKVALPFVDGSIWVGA
jgi:hypothetical protein